MRSSNNLSRLRKGDFGLAAREMCLPEPPSMVLERTKNTLARKSISKLRADLGNGGSSPRVRRLHGQVAA